MKLLLLALTFSGAFAAADCPASRPVQEMTCREAQAFAGANECYWTDDNNGYGAVAIFPVLQLDQIRCGSEETASAMWERTTDKHMCVLGYYCQPHGR